MKKTLLLLASAALLLVGCAKEQLSNGEDSGMITATFTANLESGVATRAVADGDGAAANVNRCIMEIYYGDALYARQISKVTDKQATFNAQVVSNRGYTVAFWADCVDNATSDAGLAADKYYNTASLKEITIKGSYIGNDDARDAFYVCEPFTVQQTGGSFSATLKRPFAQMNVITTDWDKVVTVEALKPEKVNVTLKNAMVVFNAVTGEASGSQDITYEAAVYTAPAPVAPVSATDKTLSMDYLFASATKGVIDIDWKALHGTDIDVKHTFAAVPYQRNYRTNIKGALLTTQGKWTVTVDPIWKAPAHEKLVVATTVLDIEGMNDFVESHTDADQIDVTFSAEPNDAGVPTTEGTANAIVTSKLKKNSDLNVTVASDTKTLYVGDFKGEKDITVVETSNAATVNITVPQGKKIETLVINAPFKSVYLNGQQISGGVGTLTNVEATTSEHTLVVAAGQSIGTLTVHQGGLEIHGTVGTLQIEETAHETNPVQVRACEGLSATVFEKIYKEGTDIDYIDPWYTFEKVDAVYNIYKLPVVATIGEKEYKSLEEAIAAVGNGQTINIVDDVDDAAGISVPSNKNFTVDFGGHTYAMECPGAGSAATKTAGFQLLKSSTIIFKNGTIKCTEANKEKTWASGSNEPKGIALMIQNYANLTLEDITIDATNIAHNGAAVRYALSNNSGTVEYKGTTSIISAAGDYAFDVCKYDSYVEPIVTWNSTGSVNGVIELTGGEFIVAKDLKLSRPIRTNSNPAILTVNVGVTVSPAQKFENVKTAFADSFNEASSGVVIVNRGGNLTIKGEGTITTTAEAHCYAAVCLTEKGEDTGADAKLTVEGNVTLEGYYYGIAGNGSRQGTDITINGGTVKGIEENNCSGIYHPQNGKLAINGGTIEGATGIYVKSGEVTTVNGGTIRGLGDKTTFEHNNSGAKVTGDAFIVENCGYPGGTPIVAISGGTFESVHASAVSSYGYNEHPALTGFISGGLFNTEPDADCIVAGKKAEQNAQGYWEIVMDELAIVNGVKYATVGEAIDAANTGDVINVYGTTNFTKSDDGFCYVDATNKTGRLVLVELVNEGSPTTNASLKVNTAPAVNSMTFQTLWGNSASRLHNPGSYLNSGDVIVLPAKTIYIEDQSTIYDVYGDITFLGKKGKTVIKPWQTSASSYRFLRLYNRYKKNITDNVIYHYNFKDVIFDGSLEKHTSANLFVVTCYNIQINMDGCTVTDFPGSVFSIWANDTLDDNSSYPTREDNAGVEVNITNSTLTGNGRLVHYDCSPYQSRDLDAGLDRYAFIHVNYDNSCTVSNTEPYSVNANTAKGQGNCLLNGADVWPAQN